MMASLDRAERAGNHLLRDGAEEVGRDQIVHVLLGQSKDFVLWRRKLVKDIIRFPFFFFPPLKISPPAVSRMDYR